MIRAPNIFTKSTIWLNRSADSPSQMPKDKFLLLDFWTFCCINCIQSLPTLKYLHSRFAKHLQIIAIHCPKFPAEHGVKAVEDAISRYEIPYPVIQDNNFQLWQEFAIRAWPTLVLISPDGYILAKNAGEADRDLLSQMMEQCIAHYGLKSKPSCQNICELTTENPSSLTLQRPLQASQKDLVKFPGKLAKLGSGPEAKILVADSGHHQILVLNHKGYIEERYGSGKNGHRDGDSSEAAFSFPQGVVISANDINDIYVADTGNHCLRVITRSKRQVRSLSNNSIRGGILSFQPSSAKEVALASPWDIVCVNGKLIIANAGTHQLAEYELDTGFLRALAGKGAENIRDGLAHQCLLAQPSGLAYVPEEHKLYFVDSETSALRYFDFKTNTVDTLIGAGLFTFGHKNGPCHKALLQHPLGVAHLSPRALLIADSYNHCLRKLDVQDKQVCDVDLSELSCIDGYCPALREPSDILVLSPHHWLISNTNAHNLLYLDWKNKNIEIWPKSR